MLPDAKTAPAKGHTARRTGRKAAGTGKKAAKRRAHRLCRARAALGVGAMTLGALCAGTAALYTEIMTTGIARRRSKPMQVLSSMALKRVSTNQWKQEESVRLMESLPSEDVSVQSREGFLLKGHWVHTDKPRRVLIMFHGWHGNWKTDFGASAAFYRDNGCEVLYAEQRTHGESEGKLISYGILERFDALKWVDYARTVYPDLPLYLCGISMGAATVLMTAGEDIADRVTGILADCGYTRPTEIITESLSSFLGRATDATVAAVNLNCSLREGFTFDEYSTTESLAKDTEVPVFFVHGDEDDFVPLRMTMENYMACRAPVELLVVHGAQHGTSYLIDTETYQKRVLAFFDRWDGRLGGQS